MGVAAVTGGHTDDGDGGALQTNKSVHILGVDADEGENGGHGGIAALSQLSVPTAAIGPCELRTLAVWLQHWIEPVEQGAPPRATKGVAAARMGRAATAKVATREKNMVGIKRLEGGWLNECSVRETEKTR